MAACADVTAATPFTWRILMHAKGLGDDAPIAISGTRDKRMSADGARRLCSQPVGLMQIG